jgi:hypothetical protein
MMGEPFPTGAIARAGGGRDACVAGREWEINAVLSDRPPLPESG